MNLEFLKTIVDIDSRSDNIEGVNLIQAIIGEYLTSLGFDVKFISNEIRQTGDLLFAQRKGLTDRAITLVCHSDTVLGPSSDFKFKIDYNEGKIYGPGIGDNKGGIALILGSLKDFLEKIEQHFYTINFISSPSEELGSIGFHDFFYEIGSQSDFVFGFEPALSTGDIISTRSGNRWYEINIKGKSAHAGRWNEPAINSAHIASEFISKISKLTCYENKRRVNISAINAGQEKFNIICENTNIKIDTRFNSFEARDFLHESILKHLEQVQIYDEVNHISSNYEIIIHDDCPPLSPIDKNDNFSLNVLKLISSIEGKKTYASYSGGAADINYFQRKDLISLDGLGPITSNMHTKNESIEIGSFYTRRKVFEEILININFDNFGENTNGKFITYKELTI